jgi:hypothetical protein
MGDGKVVEIPSLIDLAYEMSVDQPRWEWVHTATLLRLINLIDTGVPRDNELCRAVEAATLYHFLANALRHTAQLEVAMGAYAMLLRLAAKLGLWTLVFQATAELEEIFAAQGDDELPHRHELNEALMQASAAALGSEDDEADLARQCRALACKLVT